MTPNGAVPFAVGIATGIVLVGFTVYVTAPNIVERVVRSAVSRQGSRLLGLPNALLAPLGEQLGALASQETRAQLHYPGAT